MFPKLRDNSKEAAFGVRQKTKPAFASYKTHNSTRQVSRDPSSKADQKQPSKDGSKG